MAIFNMIGGGADLIAEEGYVTPAMNTDGALVFTIQTKLTELVDWAIFGGYDKDATKGYIVYITSYGNVGYNNVVFSTVDGGTYYTDEFRPVLKNGVVTLTCSNYANDGDWEIYRYKYMLLGK